MHCRQKAHSDMTKEVRSLDRFALLSFQWLVAGDSMDRAVEQAAAKKITQINGSSYIASVLVFIQFCDSRA